MFAKTVQWRSPSLSLPKTSLGWFIGKQIGNGAMIQNNASKTLWKNYPSSQVARRWFAGNPNNPSRNKSENMSKQPASPQETETIPPIVELEAPIFEKVVIKSEIPVIVDCYAE
jgi:hypothetical protein